MEPKAVEYRVNDILKQCENNKKPYFFGFLTPEEQSVAITALCGFKNYLIYGGSENAERAYLGVFPEGINPEASFFPVKAITFEFRRQYKLSHRDFLGAVLGLGLKRETVGDIFIESGRAVVFVSKEVYGFIMQHLTCVGKVGVTLYGTPPEKLPGTLPREAITVTVASLRIDCLVAALCGVSRNTAEELIADGRVALNSVIVKKATRQVNTGEKITVRGIGRFVLVNINGTTKKGRIKAEIEKYV